MLRANRENTAPLKMRERLQAITQNALQHGKALPIIRCIVRIMGIFDDEEQFRVLSLYDGTEHLGIGAYRQLDGTSASRELNSCRVRRQNGRIGLGMSGDPLRTVAKRSLNSREGQFSLGALHDYSTCFPN